MSFKLLCESFLGFVDLGAVENFIKYFLVKELNPLLLLQDLTPINGSPVQFFSRFWQALCSFLEVKLDLSPAFYPQQSSQMSWTLENYCQHFASSQQDDWVCLLQ